MRGTTSDYTFCAAGRRSAASYQEQCQGAPWRNLDTQLKTTLKRSKYKRLQNIVPTLQVAIGPVILISGVGLLLLSMTNRLGRAIDRARLLAEAYRKGTETDHARIKGQLEILWQRARLIRASIVWGAAAVVLVALLIIVLFISTLLGLPIRPEIAILFGCCMVSLIVSLIYFIRDINLSLHALQLEIDFGLKEPSQPN